MKKVAVTIALALAALSGCERAISYDVEVHGKGLAQITVVFDGRDEFVGQHELPYHLPVSSDTERILITAIGLDKDQIVSCKIINVTAKVVIKEETGDKVACMVRVP